MKRIAIIAVTILMSLTASAHSIRYFTYSQATRTVEYLNRQQEMMIYCGYDYEIETYVLINEVWMERVNSAYYEIWVYGWDAYTGDEVYMPLDLQCVWLYSAGRMYNAAQYLRFHATVHMPTFAWYIPAYHPFTRTVHRHGYTHSYHYDVHRHGWMPPTPPHHGWGPHTQPPLPPYYMRTPQTPAPAPTSTWTPGIEHPQVSTTPRNDGRGSSTIPTTRPASNSGSGTGSTTGDPTGTTQRNSGAARTGGSRTETGNDTGTGTTGRSTGTTTRGTSTTPTRDNTGTSTGTPRSGGSRSSSTTTTTESSQNSQSTTGTVNRGTATRGTATRNTTPRK